MTMNKQELFDNAHGYTARSAIVIGDSGPKITGKWGEIEQVGDQWDVWMHNKDLREGLSTVRINRAADKLDNLTDRGPINKLDGELWVTVPNLDEIAIIGPVLGIKKRKQQTEAQLNNLRRYTP